MAYLPTLTINQLNVGKRTKIPYPIASGYSIFTYIWVLFLVKVGKYTIHVWYGLVLFVY